MLPSFPILELLQDCCDPPLTPQSVEELEILLGVRFPREYVEFLLQFNGGYFHRSVGFKIPNPSEFVTGGLLPGFFGEPGDGIEDDGLVRIAETLSDRIPEDFLPIADCNGQDLVLLKLVGPKSEFQGIWFWDSDAFWISEDEQSLYWLADSFNEFLSMLVYDVCEEEEEHESLPLFQAIERGGIGAVRQFLSQGGSVETRNAQRQTLLAAASIYAWPKIVRLLLEHSADPNARDDQGRTPLHHAATHSLDSVKLLLAAGADAKARDHAGNGVLAQWWYRVDQILRTGRWSDWPAPTDAAATFALRSAGALASVRCGGRGSATRWPPARTGRRPAIG